MVQSSATTVDAYLAELAPDRREVMERLRRLARARLRGFDERMEYGMINFRRADGRGLAFASQARHISLYFGAEVLGKYRDRLGGADAGKGCLRYPKASAIDWTLVEDLLRATAAEAAGS